MMIPILFVVYLFKPHHFVTTARTQFEHAVKNQSHSVQEFDGYGSDFIKSAGHSPDAYVQVAMQLAAYRLFGKQVGTYEATQVRQFLVRLYCLSLLSSLSTDPHHTIAAWPNGNDSIRIAGIRSLCQDNGPRTQEG